MSFTGIALILLVALIVIKPEQLPEVAETLGKAYLWFRNAIGKVKGEMHALLDSAAFSQSSSEKPHEPKHS